MATSRINVHDYRGLLRAFAVAGKDTKKELNKALRDAVEPVRSDAEIRSKSAIPRIGDPWSRMRVGVTARAVYVAPRKRGTTVLGRKRRNLAGLLLNRAMIPSLESHVNQVERRVDVMLGDLADDWDRA